MNGIFLAENESRLKQVYNTETYRKLSQTCNIDYNRIWGYNQCINELISNNNTLQNIDIIFSTWSIPIFSEEEIKRIFPNLKAVFYAAGSVKKFAEPFLKNGIRVFAASKVNAIPVARYVVGLILLSNKGYFQAQRMYARGGYILKSYNRAKKFSNIRPGNYKPVIGIIGAGAVGRKVIEYLTPFEFEIFVCDPMLSFEEASDLNVTKVEMESIFKTCDVISNHLPDIPSTKKIINDDVLKLMKENVTLINTGRGGQIDEKALIKNMKARPYACSILDVTEHEPLYIGSPLKRVKNIYITPHIAGSNAIESALMGGM